MLKLDLHIHSQYSDDAEGTPEEIIKNLKKKGLNGMALTDHNTTKGAVKAEKLSTKEFIVIPGVEISTADGHMIALNIREDIPRKLSVEETVELIIEKGGTPIVPHLYRNMSGIKKEKLLRIINKISAIEVFNGCSVPQSNLKTSKIAEKYKLGGTGGSDSHVPEYTGLAYTTFKTTELKLESIISDIENKKTWGMGKTLPLSYRRDRMIKSINQYVHRGFKKI